MWPFKRKNKSAQLNLYSEKDQDLYEKYISENFGEYSVVIHEIVSDGLHIDVLPIPPAEGREYYTLITMGMGPFKMNVPEGYGKMNRAEVAMRLPKDWDISSNEEKWYWPIRVLKIMARLPYNENSWLGIYHDADFGNPFSEETELCAVMLDFFDESVAPLKLENGDELIIYNIIPLYRSEMEYKMANDADSLLAKMPESVVHGPVQIDRPSVV